MDKIDREILELELLIADYRTARFPAEQIEAMRDGLTLGLPELLKAMRKVGEMKP